MGDFQDVALHAEMSSYAHLAVDLINDKADPLHAELLAQLGLASLLPDHRLQVIMTDSQCSRGGGVRAALVQSNECGTGVQVAASIGTFCSSASIGASDIYRYSETPQVSYAATSPRLSDKLQYPFFSRTVRRAPPPPSTLTRPAADAIPESDAADAAGGG